MHRRIVFSFAVVGTLSSLCSICGGSEQKQAGGAIVSPRGTSVDLTLLRSLAGVPFQTTATEHFVIVHEARADQIAGTGRALEQAYTRFHGVFSGLGFDLSPPQEHLVWICFPQQSGFNKYALQVEKMDLSWLDGYYSTLTNRVAVVEPSPKPCPPETGDPRPANGMRITLAASRPLSERVLPMPGAGERLNLGRLTHELAHQLAFNGGLQKRGVMYPLWVSEGLATNFEFDGSADQDAAFSNLTRCNCLAEMHVAGGIFPLRQLIVQTRVPADVDLSRQFYAQAWAFFRYVMTERPHDLRTYLRCLADVPPGRRSPDVLLREFTEAFGTPESLEPAWNAFVARQIQQAQPREPEASLPPVRYTAKLP